MEQDVASKPQNRKTKEDLYRQVNTALGGSSVEVELEQDDFDVSLDEALRTYRAMSSNSVRFGWTTVLMTPLKQTYQLPSFVDEVRALVRLRSGLLAGTPFEPFSLAFFQSTFGNLSGGSADLTTFEAISSYQELIGRMFGEFIPYTFNHNTKTLLIHRLPKTDESLGIEISMTRPLQSLLSDTTSYRWLRSYTEAVARGILGEKYSKMATLPGAQGSNTLKGSKLIDQSDKMKEDLMKQIEDFMEGNEPPMPFFG